MVLSDFDLHLDECLHKESQKQLAQAVPGVCCSTGSVLVHEEVAFTPSFSSLASCSPHRA